MLIENIFCGIYLVKQFLCLQQRNIQINLTTKCIISNCVILCKGMLANRRENSSFDKLNVV